MRDGDIFSWSYTDEYLDSHKHEPYWCKSRIAVFRDDALYDTFLNNRDNIIRKCNADFVFIANFDELETANPSDRAYYLDEDCVDLNHRNSSRGNFYIRKDAKKNVEKIERILRREKQQIEKSIEYQLNSIKQISKQLKNVTVDTYVYPNNDISLNDESYQDF